MKKFIYSVLGIAIMLTSTDMQSAIITVNNNNPTPGQYSTIASAIAAASSGDTLLIHGSPYIHADFTLSKKLVIIGTGHNPQNQNPSDSRLTNVFITDAAKGSYIIGLNINSIQCSSGGPDSIFVFRNKIRVYLHMNGFNDCDYWWVEGNLFEYTGVNIYQSYYCNHWTIRNNVFNGPLENLPNSGTHGLHLITNNLFLYNGNAFYNFCSNYIYNNIFYRASPQGTNASTNTFSNNLSYQCSNNNFPNGSNIVNDTPMFVNFPNAGAYFGYSYDFHLQSSSPCIGSATDGGDIGIYGGNGYWEQNGIPNIPQIREFNITSNPTIAPGGSLNIQIKSTIRR